MKKHRILIIDETPSLHDLFREKLGTVSSQLLLQRDTEQDAHESPQAADSEYTFIQAPNPDFAVDAVRRGQTSGDRFFLAFIDIRDDVHGDGGIETAQRLWCFDPQIQVVLVVSNPDGLWARSHIQPPTSDRLLILSKPCSSLQIRQVVLNAAARFDLEAGRQPHDSAGDSANNPQPNNGTDTQPFHRWLPGMLSEDIRMPLRGTLGLFDLLLATRLAGEQREYAAACRHAAVAVLSLIDDALDVIQLETGDLQVESSPFSLSELIGDVLKSAEDTARTQGVNVRCEIPERLPSTVVGDVGRIRMALRRLLSGAIRSTSRGTVRLKAESNPRGSGWAHVTCQVSLTGQGISEEALSHLSCIRDGSTATGFSQCGGGVLDLEICRVLTEMLHGRMLVGNVSAEEAVVTLQFRVPVRGQQETVSAGSSTVTEPAPPANVESPIGVCHDPSDDSVRVLLADDHPFNRLFARRALEKLGCRVSLAENGRQSVRMFRDESYDLVLMDCEMPELDGFAATQAIRQLEKTTGLRTPVIGLLTRRNSEIRARCASAGMDDQLVKPLATEMLQEALRRWVPRDLRVTGRTQTIPDTVEIAPRTEQLMAMGQPDGDSCNNCQAPTTRSTVLAESR